MDFCSKCYTFVNAEIDLFLQIAFFNFLAEYTCVIDVLTLNLYPQRFIDFLVKIYTKISCVSKIGQMWFLFSVEFGLSIFLGVFFFFSSNLNARKQDLKFSFLILCCILLGLELYYSHEINWKTFHMFLFSKRIFVFIIQTHL